MTAAPAAAIEPTDELPADPDLGDATPSVGRGWSNPISLPRSPTAAEPADTGAADRALIAAALGAGHAETDTRVGIDGAAFVGMTAERLEETPAVRNHSFVSAPAGEPLAHLPDSVCAPSATPAELTAFFDGGTPMIGADYQRAYPLPDGRVLWLFQDAFLPTSHGHQLVHNVGLLQSGECFQLLRNGSANAPTSYLFADRTDRYDHWFWPLGGEIGDDGNLHVFVAEMVEHSGGYLRHTEPIATWLATISVDDLSVLDQRPAPDSSADLYGWSVVSAGEHTYLYSHCYRQFGYDPLSFAPEVFAHDLGCTADVTLARIPSGRFGATPEYWDGTGWVADSLAAAAVIPTSGRSINPAQIAVFDGRFVAVTKVGDWWGRTIELDAAEAPQGPWQNYETIPVEPECDGCNTYFASIMPYGADADSFIVGLSCNTWDGDGHAVGHYTPTFLRVATSAVDRTAEMELNKPGASERRA